MLRYRKRALPQDCLNLLIIMNYVLNCSRLPSEGRFLPSIENRSFSSNCRPSADWLRVVASISLGLGYNEFAGDYNQLLFWTARNVLGAVLIRLESVLSSVTPVTTPINPLI